MFDQSFSAVRMCLIYMVQITYCRMMSARASLKISSPPVILSMQKTMVAKAISELKLVNALKSFLETGPWKKRN